ncbi:MAG: hypothetical protein DWQ34_16930 [Planctomycetota bacterium]|nr:MAG: hypothetical protein DWQ34_16930 [Planctomycetota bacterium]
MSAGELLLDLGRLGIRLESDGERLRYFPRSAVTPDLIGRLKAHKGDLLAILARRDTEAEKPAERPAVATCAIDDATWDFVPVASVSTPWCPVYRHPRAWRSIYGDHLICATCHPPATPEIVAEYLTFEQAMP